MKIMCWILALVLVLSGCSAAETFETVGDVDMTPVAAESRQLGLTVPEQAVALQGDSGTLYLCDGYTLTAQVLASGDLSGTVQTLTGFGSESLTVIETAVGDMRRYECVWTGAGEGGDTVGRVLVLDDGRYHYCVTMEYAASDAAAMQTTWTEIAQSVRIE